MDNGELLRDGYFYCESYASKRIIRWRVCQRLCLLRRKRVRDECDTYLQNAKIFKKKFARLESTWDGRIVRMPLPHRQKNSWITIPPPILPISECFMISLIPFTTYTLNLFVRPKVSDKIDYITMASTTLLAPESVPTKPRIDEAKLVNNTHIRIDWFTGRVLWSENLVPDGHCPGYLRRYSTKIWCSITENSAVDSDALFSVPFDCRRNVSFPFLIVPLQTECDGDTINVQVSSYL